MIQNEKTWLDILGSAIIIFILAGVVIFMTIPKAGKRDFLELGSVLALTLLTEIIVNIMVYVTGGNHNLVYNISNIITLPMIVLLYNHRAAWKSRKIPALIIIAYILFSVINLFWIQGTRGHNTYSLAVSSALFMIISISYFFKLIRELPTESITTLPMFWINTAILITYSGLFFIYLSADYLTNVLRDNMIASWLVHNSLWLVYYAMLCYALLLIRASSLEKTR